MSKETMWHQGAKEAVLRKIPTGYDRYRIPVTSGLIAAELHLNERLVRELIEELRNEGHLICNRQDRHGYFIAETEEDVRRQYKQDCARAMSILRRIKPFRHYLRNLNEERGDQITWEDLAIEDALTRGEI